MRYETLKDVVRIHSLEPFILTKNVLNVRRIMAFLAKATYGSSSSSSAMQIVTTQYILYAL